MTTFNPVDTQYSIIAESTAGTLPGTGTLLKLPVDIGATLPNVESDFITSPVARPNRSVEAARRVNYRGAGNFGLHLFQDPAIELLMESVCSGAFATNVLKGGNTDQPFSIEELITTGQYRRFLGNYGTSFSLNLDFNGNAGLTVGFLGLSGTTATTASSLTYADAATTDKLTGVDASATIAGITSPSFRSAQLTINQAREVQGKFGGTSGFGIGASSPREVTLDLSFYHEDLTAFTTYLSADDPIAVSLTVGSTGTGYTFALPAAVPETPKRGNQGSAVMVNMRFRGVYDATEATDIKITKL